MSDRVLNLFNLGMGRYPSVNVDVHMESMFSVCREYFKTGEAFVTIKGPDGPKKEANAIYISDLGEDEHSFWLLLVRGDPGRSLPSFVNPRNRVVTPIKSADPNDVPGASSHLVIAKKSNPRGVHQGRHRAAMERARGISRALARDFLTSLMARYAEEHQDEFMAEKVRRTKNERPEQLSYRPTVAFHPEENGSLKKDLEEGKIGGFKLRRGNTQFQGEADDAKIQQLDVQLTARIIPTQDYGRVRSLIDHVRQAFDNVEFETLNFELVDEEGAPMINTKIVDVQQLEENDLRYVRTIPMVDLGDDLSDCYANFYPPILKAAQNALVNAKNWG